ncbi:hypothetical protein NL676_023630 [Syzygium grande]|nr:hypothetical protein NL676_023630 [Syzygium grande]
MLQWTAWDVRKLEVVFLPRKRGSLSWFHHSCQVKQRIMLHMEGAVQGLLQNGMLTADAIDKADEESIRSLIYPVGFYTRKASYERWVEQRPWYMCRYSCALHMQSAWLGFSDQAESRHQLLKKLERHCSYGWLPKEEWVPINPLLVGFGQTICTPLRPRCDKCGVNELCPSAFMETMLKKKS